MKKKTEEVKPEIKTEETKKDAVSVEMTAEQKDEFVAHMKDKQDKEALEKENNALFSIELAYGHYINGRRFGPGTAQVKREHLGLLQKAEQRQLYRELTLNQSAKNFYKVVAKGQAVKVASL